MKNKWDRVLTPGVHQPNQPTGFKMFSQKDMFTCIYFQIFFPNFIGFWLLHKYACGICIKSMWNP